MTEKLIIDKNSNENGAPEFIGGMIKNSKSSSGFTTIGDLCHQDYSMIEFDDGSAIVLGKPFCWCGVDYLAPARISVSPMFVTNPHFDSTKDRDDDNDPHMLNENYSITIYF